LTRRRKVPLRVCVGCQEKKPKKSLMRIVRTPEGTIELDTTGKKSGRGVYVCPQKDCLNLAQKGNRLGKQLNRRIPEALINQLWSNFEQSESFE